MVYFGIFLESYRVSALRKGYSFYLNPDKLDKPQSEIKDDRGGKEENNKDNQIKQENNEKREKEAGEVIENKAENIEMIKLEVK